MNSIVWQWYETDMKQVYRFIFDLRQEKTSTAYLSILTINRVYGQI